MPKKPNLNEKTVTLMNIAYRLRVENKMTLAQIGDILGITREYVRQLLSFHSEYDSIQYLEVEREQRRMASQRAYEKRKQINSAKMRNAQSHRPRLTDDQHIANLRRAYTELEPIGSMSIQEFAVWARANNVPGPQTIIMRFGSWTNGLRQAGLPVGRYNRIKRIDAVSSREAIQAVARVAVELGKNDPTYAEYEQYRRASEPSGSTVRSLFDGSWHNALRAYRNLLKAQTRI